MPLPKIANSAFTAYIADNHATGIHRKGYNGVASLIPHGYGNNIFVPSYAGLNYETIGLAGLPPYFDIHKMKFEPRSEPMSIVEMDEDRVVLEQPETSHSHVSARITFRVAEPHYLHQKIKLTFHQRFCEESEPNLFTSLWASYINQPADRHVYLQRPNHKAELDRWIGLTREEHGSPAYDIRHLPDQAITSTDHLFRMHTSEPVDDRHREAIENEVRSALPYYFGICAENLTYLMMFAQPDRVRLAYSPNGGGKAPKWSPAWDYVLHLDDAHLNTTYTWDVCLALLPFEGRAAILEEVRQFQANPL